MKKERDYVIYSGDDLPIFVGNKEECMDYLGYEKATTFNNLLCKSTKGVKTGGRRIFRIEEDANGKKSL